MDLQQPQPQNSHLERLPLELLEFICTLLDAQDLFCVRLTCKTLADTTKSLSLWKNYALRLGRRIPIHSTPSPSSISNVKGKGNSTAVETESESVKGQCRLALEWAVLTAERLDHTWNQFGAQPKTVFKTRAHMDRITCLKLVLGPIEKVSPPPPSLSKVGITVKDSTQTTTAPSPLYRRKRWLITGAVDGYIRVWDLTRPLPDERKSTQATPSTVASTSTSHISTPTLSTTGSTLGSIGASTSRSDSFDLTDDGVHLADNSATLANVRLPQAITCSLTTNNSSLSLSSSSSTSAGYSSLHKSKARKRRKKVLLAEVDTGGDVTAIDAELSKDGKSLHIAVGSYYSSSACLVYVLDLSTKPMLLDCRGALDPPHWCGTQCNSILADKVAVGTYTGLLHILDWKTGWRGGIERTDRSSTAAVKLFPNHLIAITRLGVIELFSLPTERHATSNEEQPLPHRSSSMTSLLSLSDEPSTPSSTFSRQGQSRSERVPGELVERYAILESNKPLLSVSFGESTKQTLNPDEKANHPSFVASNKTMPLSLFAADLGGLTHLVFDPIDQDMDPQQEVDEGEYQQQLPSSQQNREDAKNKQNSRERQPFPYHWPPRIVSRQSIVGERLIGAATGATGRRGIIITSLGGVPPVCCVRSYADSRPWTTSSNQPGGLSPSSPFGTLKTDDRVSVDADKLDTTSTSGATVDHFETEFDPAPLLLPLQATPDVCWPDGEMASRRSSRMRGSTGRPFGILPPTPASPPSPFSSATAAAATTTGIGIGIGRGGGNESGPFPSRLVSRPFTAPGSDAVSTSVRSCFEPVGRTTAKTSITDSEANESARFSSSSTTTLTNLTSDRPPTNIPATSDTTLAASIHTRQQLQQQQQHYHHPAPLSEPPSPSTNRPRLSSFESVSPSTSLSSLSTTSTAPFATNNALSHPYSANRADILTEAAIDEDSGLVCLATARGIIWIADYSQYPEAISHTL